MAKPEPTKQDFPKNTPCKEPNLKSGKRSEQIFFPDK